MPRGECSGSSRQETGVAAEDGLKPLASVWVLGAVLSGLVGLCMRRSTPEHAPVAFTRSLR